MDLVELGADVDWPDSEASTALRERLVGEPGLGRLAAVAEWLVGVRAAGTPFAKVRVLLIGAEPSELVLDTAATVGAEVRTVDADGDIAAGAAIVDDEVERGTDLLIASAPEMRADVAVAASVLTGTEPVKVLPRGVAVTDPDEWMGLAVEVRDTRRRCKPLGEDPDALLRELGAPRLCVLSGILLRAAARRTPVLLDGPVACAGALIAYEAAPRAVRWWAVADQGPDPLDEIALARLGQEPILGLGTGRGDGLTGLLALPALRAATILSAG